MTVAQMFGMVAIRPLITVITCLIVATASPASSQAPPYPIEIRHPFGRGGWRVAPLPPGAGGGILVIAPDSLCGDETHELELLRAGDHGSLFFAVRVPAGPSLCRWEVEGLAPGDYEARIKTVHDKRVVATAPRGEVVPGGVVLMQLEVANVEVEGYVTLDGVPATGVRLHFRYNGAHYDWYAPVDENGFYRVTLDGRGGGSFCLSLERALPFNDVTINIPRPAGPPFPCRVFYPGPQRFDVDLHIPPGLIRIHVPPLKEAVQYDAAYVLVRYPGSSSSRSFTSSRSIRLAEGFRGEFFGHGYREYEVSVSRTVPHAFGNGDEVPILTSARVALSVERPVEDVVLTVTPDQWQSSIPYVPPGTPRPPLPLKKGASNEVR
jgi:hypothetical protein